MRIPLQLIEYCVSHGLEKQLAAFMYLKSRKRNSCLYNYKNGAVASEHGLSKNTFRKYINLFKERGWVREHKGSIVFRNTRTIYLLEGCVDKVYGYRMVFKNKKTISLRIDKNSSMRDVLDEIRIQIPKKKKETFYKNRKLSLDTLNSKKNTLDEVKSLKKREKNLKKFIPDLNRLSKAKEYKTSYVTIGRHLKTSSSTVSRLMKRMHEKGRVKVIPGEFERVNFNKLHKGLPENNPLGKTKETKVCDITGLPIGMFRNDGRIFKRTPNTIIFL